ncbi:MAG: LysR family transcriptional regulator [Cohaesibacter sp.]|nr:LysR family transcriptional regulator [Cohaesibacter sp.]MCV6602091.1 LysR family transcriptional regulator [Cohaesibacter sp.]
MNKKTKQTKISRLKHIEAFSAVITHGSMSAAATELGISQPAVSQLIKQLEETIGVPLFIRRNGAIFPSARAETLRDDAVDLLHKIDKLQMQLSYSQTQILSTIRLSASMSFTNEILPILLAYIHQRHEDATFYVNSLPLVNMIEAVARGNVDFAFHTQPLQHSNILNTKLAEVPQVCVMPTHHALADYEIVPLHALSGYRIASPSRADPSYQYYMDLFQKHRVRTKTVLQSPFASFAMKMLPVLDLLSFNNALIADIICKENADLVWRPVEGLDAVTSFYLGCADWLGGSDTLHLIEEAFLSSFNPLMAQFR